MGQVYDGFNSDNAGTENRKRKAANPQPSNTGLSPQLCRSAAVRILTLPVNLRPSPNSQAREVADKGLTVQAVETDDQ